MRFHEQQRFRQPWLWGLLLSVSLPVIFALGYGIYRQLILGRPFGTKPTSDPVLAVVVIVTLLILAAAVVMMAMARLDVAVTDGEVVIFFPPFHRQGRRIPLSEIAEARARTYSPLIEYGGWGIRYGFQGMAYNVSGNEGVQLVLTNGKRILIGSQRSKDLEKAITGR